MNILFLPDISFHNLNIKSIKIKNVEDFFQKKIIKMFPKSYKILNLEANNIMGKNKKILSLKFSSKEALFLKKIGINGVSLANNHTFDNGLGQFKRIAKILKKNKINYFGAGINLAQSSKPIVIKENSAVVGVFGLSYKPESNLKKFGIFSLKSKETNRIIKKNKKKYKIDYTVLYCHSGIELYKYPLIRDENNYKKMIDLGANVIIGSHPHMVQKFEIYKKRYIFYSIGDLFFTSNIKKQYKRLTTLPAHGFFFKKESTIQKLKKSLMISINIKNNITTDIYEISRDLNFNFKIKKLKKENILNISKKFAKDLKKDRQYRNLIEKKISTL